VLTRTGENGCSNCRPTRVNSESSRANTTSLLTNTTQCGLTIETAEVQRKLISIERLTRDVRSDHLDKPETNR
jgi:hypothetical protein